MTLVQPSAAGQRAASIWVMLFLQVFFWGFAGEAIPAEGGAYTRSTGVPSAYTWVPDPIYSKKTMEDPLWLQYHSRGQAFENCPPMPLPAIEEPAPGPKPRSPRRRRAKVPAMKKAAAPKANPCPPMLMPIFIKPDCPDKAAPAKEPDKKP